MISEIVFKDIAYSKWYHKFELTIYKNNFVYTPIFFSTWYLWLTLSVIKNQLLISWNDFNNSTNSMFDITISISHISKYLDIISEIKWEISATPEQIWFWRFH